MKSLCITAMQDIGIRLWPRIRYKHFDKDILNAKVFVLLDVEVRDTRKMKKKTSESWTL